MTPCEAVALAPFYLSPCFTVVRRLDFCEVLPVSAPALNLSAGGLPARSFNFSIAINSLLQNLGILKLNERRSP